MTNEDKALILIDKQVKQYREMQVMDGNKLNEIMQQIVGSLHFLEGVRSEVHHNWQLLVKNKIDEGFSVARAENLAHVEYPLMYKLRHKMNSGYEVVNAIRSNLSWIKTEMRSV
jgi:hypothetical protein